MAKGEKDFGKPVDDEKAELKSKPKAYAGEGSNVEKEAEERKSGGRAGRKRGGKVKHHEKPSDLKHAKDVGKVHGSIDVHKGREPRKAGGRTGSNFNPMSSAAAGVSPRGHKTSN